jgi:hypothetical protein
MGPIHTRRPRLCDQSAHGARRQRRGEQRTPRGLRGRGRAPGRGGAAARGGRARRGRRRPRRAAAGRALRGWAALRGGGCRRAQKQGHELGGFRGGQAAAAQRELLPWGARPLTDTPTPCLPPCSTRHPLKGPRLLRPGAVSGIACGRERQSALQYHCTGKAGQAHGMQRAAGPAHAPAACAACAAAQPSPGSSCTALHRAAGAHMLHAQRAAGRSSPTLP